MMGSRVRVTQAAPVSCRKVKHLRACAPGASRGRSHSPRRSSAAPRRRRHLARGLAQLTLYAGLAPTGDARIRLRAEPPLAIFGADDRVVVMFLAANMVDALAGIDRDVSFD